MTNRPCSTKQDFNVQALFASLTFMYFLSTVSLCIFYLLFHKFFIRAFFILLSPPRFSQLPYLRETCTEKVFFAFILHNFCVCQLFLLCSLYQLLFLHPSLFPWIFLSQLWFSWLSRTVLPCGRTITAVTLTLALCVSDSLWPLGTMAPLTTFLAASTLTVSQRMDGEKRACDGGEWGAEWEQWEEGGKVCVYVCVCVCLNIHDTSIR